MRRRIYLIASILVIFILVTGAVLTVTSPNSWVRPGLAAPLAGPQLSIPDNIPAQRNSTVDVPVNFTSNGNQIASTVFSIDYDETWLDFNSFAFNLPSSFTGSCAFDASDTDGELDCYILDPLAPLEALPDGTVLNVTLNTLDPPTSILAKVGFSLNSPPTSFGSTSGTSVPGTTDDGSVQIGGPTATPTKTPNPQQTPWAFLPAIFRHYLIAPPPTLTPTITPSPSVSPSPTPTGTPSGCTELIVNGGFETVGKAWEIPITEYTAGYSTAQKHSGKRSMRTGIDPPNYNIYSYSSARQKVTIPSSAKNARLRLWMYPISSEANLSQPRPEITLGKPFGSESFYGDFQYILVLDQNNNVIWVFYNELSNERAWIQKEFFMGNYAGMTIKVEVGTYNDGWGGISAMYVDDVSIQACP